MSIKLGVIVGPDRAYDDGSTLAERFENWAEAQGKRPRFLSEFLDPSANPKDGLLTFDGDDLFEQARALGVAPYVNFNLLPGGTDSLRDMLDGAVTKSGLTASEHLTELGKRLGAFSGCVRFMHEFNGGRKPWDLGVCGAATYREAFAFYASTLKENAPNIRTVWCPSSGGKQPWLDAYPGDEFVDVIACDIYPAVESDEALVERKYATLQAVYNFALSRGKPFAIGACGLGGGVDDPGLATRFGNWLLSHPNTEMVTFGEAIFSGHDTRMTDGKHPRVLAEWRRYATKRIFKGARQ